MPAIFPNLNDIIEACQSGRRGGGRRASNWANLKAKCHKVVAENAPKDVSSLGYGPFLVLFRWVEWNQRRDPDNISAGGTKPVFDAMQSLSMLSNDGWKQIGKIVHEFEVAETESECGVHIYLYKCDEIVKRKTPQGRGEYPWDRRVYIPIASRKRRKQAAARGKQQGSSGKRAGDMGTKKIF